MVVVDRFVMPLTRSFRIQVIAAVVAGRYRNQFDPSEKSATAIFPRSRFRST